MQEPLPSLKIIIANLFGFKTGVTDYVNCCFAWYVSFYIMFLLVYAPLIIKISNQKKSTMVFIIFIVGLCFVEYGITICNPYLSTLWYGLGYLPTIVTGFLSAKNKWFSWFYNFIRRWKLDIRLTILVLFMGGVVLRKIFGQLPGVNLDYFCEVLVVYAILLGCRSVNISARKEVVPIADLSMNLWFFHAIFFTPNRTLQWVAYRPKVGILIVLWALIILIPISYFLQVIQLGVLKKFHLSR